MANSFTDIKRDQRLSGVVAGSDVTVVAVAVHGPTSATLTYRTADNQIEERVITLEDLSGVHIRTGGRWTFDADGESFRLASEARRMKWAHLADPFAAVDTSNIEPYPHQIDAVYNRFLTQKPLRFLLADDPGAGKTVMSGLLIRELMLRGDVARCLIVAPGSLVEQWQDELWEKFGLRFELMSRHAVEAALTGNPFIEKNLLIARMDQLSRAEDLQAKLAVTEWDLVIVDEAHKMSAHQYGNEFRKTRRFVLGELLREKTRHLLLLSATPHNGKDEDFLAFMTLIDPARFAGRLRSGEGVPDVKDVMRRLVKENLRTFEGRRLFPKRYAESLKFELSDAENELYEAVTSYVRTGMNRALRMQEEGDRRQGLMVGFALAGLQRRLASSPAAIYHSLRRRRERLTDQVAELRRLAAGGAPIPAAKLPPGVRIADLEDFDFDDFDDEEMEQLEDQLIDAATAAATADELEVEVAELAELVALADGVRQSGTDTKWNQLRDLLRSPAFRQAEGPRKLIVFSEHKDTLTYVHDRVANELGRPDAVVTIHGGMKREDRRTVQDRFRVDPGVHVLVATDAAGEGVNLQVANLMVNYDLPWNPNRIEQRFGRIHRIGQQRPCHLWNLVAHKTREGMVFERLFAKIEQQKAVYEDQVYDVLGDPQINRSLQELLLRAIRDDASPAHAAYMNEVIDHDIGDQLGKVLEERALVAGLGGEASVEKIRDLMEQAKARRLQPYFVETFFSAALKEHGGRMVGREPGRFEITRVPAAVRSFADPSLGPVHDRYSRVAFDKRSIQPDGHERAELIAPGTPLLSAVVERVLADHGAALDCGATLIAPDDPSTEPRLLVYLDHTVTDGRHVGGRRQVVSRRFQYVEIDAAGNVIDPGSEPYLGYQSVDEARLEQIHAKLDLDWVDKSAEETARGWAIENLAAPHFAEVSTVVQQRVEKVRRAVKERLEAEIRHWDQRAVELKDKELAGQKAGGSARARARADDLEARMVRRRVELDLEADLHNTPPSVIGAALIIPQGLIDALDGSPPPIGTVADKLETDRRGVAAVCKAEVALGRQPEPQKHNNPGFDIESVDPRTGVHYFIEVKSHLPQTEEISVSAQQVNKAKSNPERWRLAIASVPSDPDQEPVVRYLVEPFRDVVMHFAQPKVPLKLAHLLKEAGDPC